MTALVNQGQLKTADIEYERCHNHPQRIANRKCNRCGHLICLSCACDKCCNECLEELRRIDQQLQIVTGGSGAALFVLMIGIALCVVLWFLGDEIWCAGDQLCSGQTFTMIGIPITVGVTALLEWRVYVFFKSKMKSKL